MTVLKYWDTGSNSYKAISGPPGPQGPPGVGGAVSADANNFATLGSDGLVYVPKAVQLVGDTMTGALSVSAAAPQLMITATAGTARQVLGQTAGSTRWGLVLGNTTAESAGNVGSDFGINRYDNTGAPIDTPFSITRSSGQVAIRGTQTNDNAAAGFVGEVVAASVGSSPGVAVTSATPTNVTSISLTAGDWDVYGEIWFQMGTGGATACLAGISTASANLPGPGIGAARFQDQVAQGANVTLVGALRTTRISIAGTTPVYLVTQVNFPSGTQTVYGNIWARRMR